MVISQTTPTPLTPKELARYSRQVILREVGREGQERIKAARVLVIGMGGLGSPVALYMAAAGVGTMGLADFDTVAEHNLQRQILHGDANIRAQKLDSARERLREISPYIHLTDHPDGITVENAARIIAQYDIVVDGSDNFPTRYLVNDACHLAGKPLVYGSIFQFEGQVSLFNAGADCPCYRCLFPEMPAPGTVPNCEEAGVFGALCGVIGSMQAMEALKHVGGFGESIKGRLLVTDTLNMRFRSVNLKKDPECPLCGENPSITELCAENYQFSCSTPNTKPTDMETDETPVEINVMQAKSLLDSAEPPLLLDVREPFELDICRIDSPVNIPLGELGTRLQELPKERHILVNCHHGGRSMKAVRILRERGYPATNIAGGIHVWSEQIDPTLPKY